MCVLNLKRWPTFAVFLFAGALSATFAFVTVNLFSHAMASAGFLRKFGWVAVQHGALWQVGELVLWGALALSCWIGFKVCEHILVDRYLRWAAKRAPK